MRDGSCRESRAVKKTRDDVKRSLLLVVLVAGCAHAPMPVPIGRQVESLTRIYSWSQINLTMEVEGRYTLAPDGDIYGFTRINNSTDAIAQVTPQGTVTAYAISGFPLNGASNQAITPNPNGDIYA